jgi:putative lipid kinase YegS-like protein
MTPISKGSPYGEPGPLPADGVIVRSDGEARAVVEPAMRLHRPLPTLGLLGGDLCRTLGGPTDAAHLRSDGAVRFPVDVGEVLLDGRLHWFVAHLMARSRGWGEAFVAMNAQWLGRWELGPHSHPGDGLLDTYQARLSLADRLRVRARLHGGGHLPHPGIRERRAPAVQVELSRHLPVLLDGQPVGRARNVSVRVRPDALTVVI